MSTVTDDDGRWQIRHDFPKADGEVAATLTIGGGWLDLRKRKLTPPPPELFQLFGGAA